MSAGGVADVCTPDERRALTWIYDEIERRHPEIAYDIEQAFNVASAIEERTGTYVHVDYTAVILSALEAHKS